MALQDLAAAKVIDEGFLREHVGLQDRSDGAVLIPYWDERGDFLFDRVRAPEGDNPRFRQPQGQPTRPYGLWRLDRARGHGELWIAEGESDTWALWASGFAALGIPGSQNVGCLQADHLRGVDEVYLCPDRDEAGLRLAQMAPVRIRELGFQGRLRLIELPPGEWGKDVCDYRIAHPDDFPQQMRELARVAKDLLSQHHRNGQAKAAAEDDTESVSPRTADDVCSIDDLAKAGSQVSWLWEGWLPSGVCTALAAEGGIGKTRFCADLVRRIARGFPWPDGTPMTLPPDSKVLWVMSDNHHDEMVTLARAFNITEHVRVNAWKDDPYAGVTLETTEDLAALDARMRLVQPVMVIIDTVGNATDKNLSRQEDAKAFYAPLQVLARRHRCAMVCLTHLNADGRFLGRRVLEKVRVAIKIEKPDPDQEKRKLSVPKTNSKPPAPLGLMMGDWGNEYDHDPPEVAQEPGMGASRKAKSGAAESWLSSELDNCSRRVSELRTAAETVGISAGSLYRAKEKLDIVEFVVEGKKWWRLTSKDEASD